MWRIESRTGSKAKKCCRKLVRDFCQPSSVIEVVMDDESHFPYKNDGTRANGGFYTKDKENTPPEIRYRTTKKFPDKLLVWIAISERGHSGVLLSSPSQCEWRNLQKWVHFAAILLASTSSGLIWPALIKPEPLLTFLSLRTSRMCHALPTPFGPTMPPSRGVLGCFEGKSLWWQLGSHNRSPTEAKNQQMPGQDRLGHLSWHDGEGKN